MGQMQAKSAEIITSPTADIETTPQEVNLTEMLATVMSAEEQNVYRTYTRPLHDAIAADASTKAQFDTFIADINDNAVQQTQLQEELRQIDIGQEEELSQIENALQAAVEQAERDHPNETKHRSMEDALDEGLYTDFPEIGKPSIDPNL